MEAWFSAEEGVLQGRELSPAGQALPRSPFSQLTAFPARAFIPEHRLLVLLLLSFQLQVLSVQVLPGR